ncbi:MAG: N-acetylmuramoyl-L-alanine amidase [Gemmatimonadota bacterium]|nr:N-acetylmuramoyl-L-alanine amidase [Gemmatimonadota bacterium]
MSRWTDLATWVGSPNHGGAAVEQRGVVLHIAEGAYAGTLAWCQNPSSKVSAHFIAAKDGRAAQLVDTDIAAWTQVAGNGRWLSIEFEGHAGDSLTQRQLEFAGRVLARAHQQYGVPLQLVDSPTGRGLGWHGMGGTAWGGHTGCPGAPIVAQRGQVIGLAEQIIDGGTIMQLTGPDPWGDGSPNEQAAELRNVHAAIMSGYQDDKAKPEGVIARLGRIESVLTAAGGSPDIAPAMTALAGLESALNRIETALKAAGQAQAGPLRG